MTVAENTNFLKELSQLSNINNDRLPFQKRAWDVFEQMGLPDRKMEAYKSYDLAKLYAEDFSLQATAEDQITQAVQQEIQSDANYITLVDGTYRADLSHISASDLRLVILPFRKAFNTYRTLIENRMETFLNEEKDPFALLNVALMEEGVFIYIPPKTVLQSPIKIITVYTRPAASLIMAVMGRQSQSEIVFKQIDVTDRPLWTNQLFDCLIEDGAHFKAITLPQEKADVYCMQHSRITQKADSHYSDIYVSKGSTLSRKDIYLKLVGAGAEAHLMGMNVLKGSLQSGVHAFVEHTAPNCFSKQLYKNILQDNSKSTFIGEIFVCPSAQKTDAYQLNNNLLLSDTAEAESQPKLEIFADDVKASHGSTTGQIDQELLFYLQTRGIAVEDATKMLLAAFCAEVLENIENPAIIETVHRVLQLD